MSGIYRISEMDEEALTKLKEDKDTFIRMCLEEIYYLSGYVEGMREIVEIRFGEKGE